MRFRKEPVPLPLRLGKDPILEAVAELRFRSSVPDAGTVLVGFLFTQLRKRFPNIERLPAADLPAQLRQLDPKLQYTAQHRLFNETESLMVGDKILAVSTRSPYPGWNTFKPHVVEAWDQAKESKLVEDIERMSIKYTNLLESPHDANHISLTRVKLSFGDRDISSESFQIQTEFKEGAFVAIVQLVAQAVATDQSSRKSAVGLVVSIDAIRSGPFDNFWSGYSSLLDQVHEFEKGLFFDLLATETLKVYEPEYPN